MSNHNCVFCKIVSGEIPSHKVYEDDRVLAFLDVGPISRGHTLVIPKAHADRLDALEPEDGAAMGRALPTVGAAVMRATGAEDFNVLQNNGEKAGQAVFHVHFHVIPRHSGSAREKPSEDSEGLCFYWPAMSLDREQGEALAERIHRAIEA